MIELRRRQWIIDQTSRGLFSGEVHYFRLARRDWRSRLLDLRAAGAQAVATYIPWVVHELPDGTIDVTARTADWRDLGAFCDLAHELGLFVIARPGPYVMAELQHEGLPHRVMHLPDLGATTWDGQPLPTADLDHLSATFLAEVERWYDAVLPVLAGRLRTVPVGTASTGSPSPGRSTASPHRSGLRVAPAARTPPSRPPCRRSTT